LKGVILSLVAAEVVEWIAVLEEEEEEEEESDDDRLPTVP
jgi:hypothetical protein